MGWGSEIYLQYGFPQITKYHQRVQHHCSWEAGSSYEQNAVLPFP